MLFQVVRRGEEDAIFYNQKEEDEEVSKWGLP